MTEFHNILTTTLVNYLNV